VLCIKNFGAFRRYAAQTDYDEPHLTNGRADWIDIDQPELLCWFGILILMGMKQLPNRRMYWDSRPFYSCPLISTAMTRTRFEAIVRCIHLVDNETLQQDSKDPTFDKIGKVRWLIEDFAQKSRELYNPERVLTVDEIMVPYKGRYCGIRQYMKSKPCRFGIKIWALASSSSRLVSCFG
jgi:hypothetical protein